MIGAGTILNPILKIVTTVAILGAIYFFIVAPILDTTEKVVDRSAKQFQQSQAEAAKHSQQVQLDVSRSRAESYAQSLQTTWPQAGREVQACVRENRTDARRLERCAELGRELTHSVQSDRSFALSYANSLAAQGRAADADRVEGCVKEAGFSAGRMQRCRDLADQLLFG